MLELGVRRECRDARLHAGSCKLEPVRGEMREQGVHEGLAPGYGRGCAGSVVLDDVLTHVATVSKMYAATVFELEIALIVEIGPNTIV